jgi:exodeoxyribonuclease VII large subunit
MDNNAIGLLELNSLIKEIIEGNFMGDIWLIAEIADLKVNSASGHCYLELIEKKNDQVVAKMRANIWSFNYQKIAQRFFKNTGTNLQNGLKILFSASVSYHEIYGPSLVIKNIDENFTIGDHEKNKKEIYNRLLKEGFIGRNNQLELPVFTKKIAVISSDNAAGLEDFLNQLHHNPKKFVFETTLFPAIMQGEKIYISIIQQLLAIQQQKEEFDCIAIIRGGGANMDLNGFNNYELCKCIAECSLPVISGIGHDRDHTLVDDVVHTKLKTPTAVAEFFIRKSQDIYEYLEGLKTAFEQITREKLVRNKQKVNRLGLMLVEKSSVFNKKQNKKINELKDDLGHFCIKVINHNKNQLQNIPVKLSNVVKQNKQIKTHKLLNLHQKLVFSFGNITQKQTNLLDQCQKTLKYLHPQNVLNRGYAIIKNQNQVIVKSKNEFNVNEKFTIVFKDGEKTIINKANG